MVRAHPLVGNAIRHGLSPKIGPGRLSIEVSSQGPLLILAVEDDGRGATLPLATGLGVGNTRERLHALYSDRAALSIDTAPDAVSAEPVSNSPWEDHIDA